MSRSTSRSVRYSRLRWPTVTFTEVGAARRSRKFSMETAHLRAVEIADLEWSQVEWGRNPALHVRRAKSGKPAVHPIRGDELRMLRELQRNTTGAFVFETERGGPFTADAVNRLVKTIGARAKLSFGVHAHMLRHACGYALANAGHDTRLIQDWLGHRAIQHTARYTELSPTRFKEVWR